MCGGGCLAFPERGDNPGDRLRVATRLLPTVERRRASICPARAATDTSTAGSSVNRAGEGSRQIVLRYDSSMTFRTLGRKSIGFSRYVEVEQGHGRLEERRH